MGITIIRAAKPKEVKESDLLISRFPEYIQKIIIVARTTDGVMPVSNIKQNEKIIIKKEKVRFFILNSLQKAERSNTI